MGGLQTSPSIYWCQTVVSHGYDFNRSRAEWLHPARLQKSRVNLFTTLLPQSLKSKPNWNLFIIFIWKCRTCKGTSLNVSFSTMERKGRKQLSDSLTDKNKHTTEGRLRDREVCPGVTQTCLKHDQWPAETGRKTKPCSELTHGAWSPTIADSPALRSHFPLVQ